MIQASEELSLNNIIPKEEINTIEYANKLIANYDYENSIKICLNLLEKDYNDGEAHALLMQIFTELGSRNLFVIEGRRKVKDLFLRQERLVYW